MKEKKILVIIGPSGVGKTSIVRMLRDKALAYPIPSWTTRPPRPGEREENIDHIFVSEEEFDRKAGEGFFLEEVTLFGLPYKYGLPPIDFNLAARKVPVLLLRAPLLPLLIKHYPNHVIYQLEDSYERVAERLKEREKSGEHQGERLALYKKEITIGREIAHRIFINKSSLVELESEIERAIREDFKEENNR